MSQHQKIINLCKDGQWHCGNEFRDMYIFSAHKRRCEIEGRENRHQPITGKYYFEDRKCEHGHKGVRDYIMFPTRPPQVPEKYKVEFTNQPALFTRAQM